MNENSNVFTFEKQHVTQEMVPFNLFTQYEAIQFTVEYLNRTLRDSPFPGTLSTLFQSYKIKCYS